jgi:hypothetical protein
VKKSFTFFKEQIVFVDSSKVQMGSLCCCIDRFF